MDRVARRARTNKNAIYRRWPSRAALAVAAYRRAERRRSTPARPRLAARRRAGVASPREPLVDVARRSASSQPVRRRRARPRVARPDPGARKRRRLGDLADRRRPRRRARRGAAQTPFTPASPPSPSCCCATSTSRAASTNVSDDVLVEIVDDVYVPLLRGRGVALADPNDGLAVAMASDDARSEIAAESPLQRAGRSSTPRLMSASSAFGPILVSSLTSYRSAPAKTGGATTGRSRGFMRGLGYAVVATAERAASSSTDATASSSPRTPPDSAPQPASTQPRKA